jgi:septum formation protein
VLASASPRRRTLISRLGLRCDVEPTSVDESPRAGERPLDLARRLAESKARAVEPGSRWALGADTVVILDGHALGKPVDAADAVAMLERLRNRTHEVATGVCLLAPGQQPRVALVRTRVRMRPYSDAEIRAYVASGAPLDKAGAYGIQDAEFGPVHAILGCYTNVVGLPLCATAELLRDAGLCAVPPPETICPHRGVWAVPPETERGSLGPSDS